MRIANCYLFKNFNYFLCTLVDTSISFFYIIVKKEFGSNVLRLRGKKFNHRAINFIMMIIYVGFSIYLHNILHAECYLDFWGYFHFSILSL